jgi:hypothetical protein
VHNSTQRGGVSLANPKTSSLIFYSGKVSIKYKGDAVITAADAKIVVNQQINQYSWSIDAIGDPEGSNVTPLMKAFYEGAELDIRFRRDSGEVYSGPALAIVVEPSKKGLILELKGMNALSGFVIPR